MRCNIEAFRKRWLQLVHKTRENLPKLRYNGNLSANQENKIYSEGYSLGFQEGSHQAVTAFDTVRRERKQSPAGK